MNTDFTITLCLLVLPPMAAYIVYLQTRIAELLNKRQLLPTQVDEQTQCNDSEQSSHTTNEHCDSKSDEGYCSDNEEEYCERHHVVEQNEIPKSMPGGVTIISKDVVRLNAGCTVREFNFVAETSKWSITFQQDGNLVIYDDKNVPKWASQTHNIIRGVLKMQQDGNLVVYDTFGSSKWSSGTFGHDGSYAEFNGEEKTFFICLANSLAKKVLYKFTH